MRVLEGPGEIRRAPWMSGDEPPDGFVLRPAEYEALKEAVLTTPPGKPVALTTALVGAGGYGKTVLANVLCRDDDLRLNSPMVFCGLRSARSVQMSPGW